MLCLGEKRLYFEGSEVITLLGYLDEQSNPPPMGAPITDETPSINNDNVISQASTRTTEQN